MTKCPKCGATLKDDQGIVTCHACGAIMLIDMEGVPHIGGEIVPEPAPAPAPLMSSPIDSRTKENPVAARDANPANETSPAYDSFENSEPDFSFDPLDPSLSPSSPLLEEPAAPESAERAAIVYDNHSIEMYDTSAAENRISANDVAGQGMGYDSSSHLPYDAAPGAPDLIHQPALGPGEMLSIDDPLGLNSFANSELSAAKDGMLMCRIYIAGVDTKEIRAALRASMEDARFNWNPAEILSRLKRGQLVIEDVTPVKATILINRIKQLPLKIRWDQYTIAQADSESPDTTPSE